MNSMKHAVGRTATTWKTGSAPKRRSRAGPQKERQPNLSGGDEQASDRPWGLLSLSAWCALSAGEPEVSSHSDHVRMRGAQKAARMSMSEIACSRQIGQMSLPVWQVEIGDGEKNGSVVVSCVRSE